MDVVVKGRNVEVPEHYRQHVTDKLQKIERYDHKIIRVDVELFHERNPRQSDNCQRVEITCSSRGPVVRAEACAGDFYAALDAAISRLDARLRRAADRRRVHRGRRTPISLGDAAALNAEPTDLIGDSLVNSVAAGDIALFSRGRPTATATLHDDRAATDGSSAGTDGSSAWLAPDEQIEDGKPWHVAREKEHHAEPMSIEDALFEMELVGHDFYLFLDKESGRPSVVYRRRAYNYGVISLSA